MKSITIPVIVFIIASSVLLSCTGGGEKSKGSLKTDGASDSQAYSAAGEDDESIIYLFPAPGEVLERFYSIDMSFYPDLLNPVNKKDEYLTSRAKALNLGIYFTDFAYSLVFERQQESMDYLEALESMSREVNISPQVYESLLERTEENLGIRDSLLNISRDMFFTTLEHLEEAEMQSTMALVSAGAYIEAMYIALQSVEEYEEDHPVLQHITELRHPMNNLLQRARATSNDPNVSSIVIYLLEISEVFEELETMTTESKVTKDSSNTISITGGEEKKLTEEDFVQLRNKITEIRTNITQN
ncbi:MAG: hypothetical protein ACOCZL_00505 [Bacteroidota bacterium]